LGKKFKYSDIDGEFRKRELAPCLDLLEMAGIAHKVMRTAAQGLPLGAQIDPQYYKVLFLDIGLAQTVMGLKPNQWFLNPLKEIVNKGELVESFVGQELLAYSNPMTQHDLYYWVREKRGSEAEIDYVIQQNELILPIEVKSGHGTTLKSLRDFLKSHPASPFGIRFSINPPSIHERIYSYPLYTIASCINPDYIEQLFK
jgi:predicted AAA+ superfamily ATPase